MAPIRSRTDETEIANLEALLQATLLPRVPRESYESDLQRRLSNASAPTIEFPPSENNLLWLILLSLGVITLFVFGWKLRHFLNWRHRQRN